MDRVPEVGEAFLFSRFHPCGGKFDEPRPALFWGKDPETGIRAMKFLDDEGGMELVNQFHAHRYEIIKAH